MDVCSVAAYATWLSLHTMRAGMDTFRIPGDFLFTLETWRLTDEEKIVSPSLLFLVFSA